MSNVIHTEILNAELIGKLLVDSDLAIDAVYERLTEEWEPYSIFVSSIDWIDGKIVVEYKAKTTTC